MAIDNNPELTDALPCETIDGWSSWGRERKKQMNLVWSQITAG